MKRKFTDCIESAGESCRRFENTKWYISTGTVDEDHINEKGVEVVEFDTKPSRANLIVSEGDVLFAKMQGTKKTLFIDKPMEQYIYSTGFCAVRAKEGILTDRCLLHLLNSDTFLDQKDENCSGATQKAITNSSLKKIIVNIPEYCKQNEIADQLDRITRLIKLRKYEIEKLDDLIKARFVERFGEPSTNPKGYPIKMIKDTCFVITGNTPSRKIDEYYGGAIEWIKTDNIVSGLLYPTIASEYLSESGKTVGRTVEAGAILMACIAGSIASIGRVCITDREVAFNQQINAIVPKEYDVRFLHVLLQISKDYLVEDINMALKGIMSKSKLEEKVFIVPPMEEQIDFAEFVKRVDKSKVEVQRALDETQKLFDSMMQQYFG